MSQKSTDNRLVSIDELVITSNDGKTVNDKLPDLITDLYYYESILNETVRVQLMYADIGKSVRKDGVYKTILEGMPLVGQEDVRLKIKDINGVEIKVDLNINKITPISKDTTKSLVGLDLVSEEGIFNYNTVVRDRYDGKISDHITNILKNVLKTRKKLDIEQTTNTLTVFGNQKRPFWTIHWLAKKSVPELPNAEGNTAGFLFFETSDGFKFKSIDKLLDYESRGQKIKSFLYNQTANTPSGYDGKIAELVPPTPSGNMQSKLESGAYSTRTILFDPFNCFYEVVNPNTKASQNQKGSEKNLKKAAKDLPKLNPKFNRQGLNEDFSRTQYMLIDTGTSPSGTGSGKSQQQLQKSKEKNFDPKNILNQSSMRYNQLFSSKTEITLDYADFSLHAGDLIFVDTPELSTKETQDMDEQTGGYYLIADLCHYISITEGAFTKIVAVRDSVGRKGNPLNKPFS